MKLFNIATLVKLFKVLKKATAEAIKVFQKKYHKKSDNGSIFPKRFKACGRYSTSGDIVLRTLNDLMIKAE